MRLECLHFHPSKEVSGGVRMQAQSLLAKGSCFEYFEYFCSGAQLLKHLRRCRFVI
jgi:hypothetical protein